MSLVEDEKVSLDVILDDLRDVEATVLVVAAALKNDDCSSTADFEQVRRVILSAANEITAQVMRLEKHV